MLYIVLMKHSVILVFTFLSATVWGQANERRRTLSLLQWLIKKDQIEYLNTKSNAAVFYHKDALTGKTLITDSGKNIPDTCMKDFLSPKEVHIYSTVPKMLEQTDWRKHYSQLKAKLVTEKESIKIMNSSPVYGFSEPVFLNKTGTRVIIGEYFVCGVVCGRDDLLLCEFKNGRWRLVARAVVAND